MWKSLPHRGISAVDAGARPKTRDAAVDLVRAVALLRVIVFHASGNLVAITAIPAMPVMFFFGGRFVALSLGRRGAIDVLTDRARRLLWPASVYVGVVVMALIAGGHSFRGVGSSFVNSLVPIHGGTKDTTADWFFSTLWYLRDYLIGVAISPLLLRALRARPQLVSIGVAVAVVASFALDLGSLSATYLAFWLLGMAGASGPAFARRTNAPTWLATIAIIVAIGLGATVLVSGAWPWSEAAGNLCVGIGWLMLLSVANVPITRFALRPLPTRAAKWLQQRAVSAYVWQMLPIIALYHVARIPGRSLESATQALWLVPAAIAATLAIVAAVAPIEHRAAA